MRNYVKIVTLAYGVTFAFAAFKTYDDYDDDKLQKLKQGVKDKVVAAKQNIPGAV
jgi:hypothetical protein